MRVEFGTATLHTKKSVKRVRSHGPHRVGDTSKGVENPGFYSIGKSQ